MLFERRILFKQYLKPLSLQGLTLANYKANFSTLLWLEEMHEEMEMREFALCGVTLTRNGNFLVLEVPGVTEGRPALQQGMDFLRLKHRSNNEQLKWYFGITVHLGNF